jgi:signal transduction histidine kinase
MELAIGAVAAVVAGGIGLFVGRSRGRSAGLAEGRGEADARVRSLIEAVKRGRPPKELAAGTAEAELHEALAEGWAPRGSERQAALREAVGRVSAFLDLRVRRPLADAADDVDQAELLDRIERALGALEDLDFFIEKTDGSSEGANLVSLAQRISREFASDQDVAVRLLLETGSVRAMVNPTALMDALYLILHNAGRFGGGTTIDLSVSESDGRAHIVVRDRGEGFSEEAFARAFDPFYSTTEDGLGLGLPHARKVIEGMGGSITLRNVPDGGAEVEITLPTA